MIHMLPSKGSIPRQVNSHRRRERYHNSILPRLRQFHRRLLLQDIHHKPTLLLLHLEYLRQLLRLIMMRMLLVLIRMHHVVLIM